MVRTFLVSVVFHCSFASNLHPFYYWFSPLVQGLAIPRSINKTRKDSFKAPLISKLSVLSAFFQRTSRKEGALENVLKATKWRTFFFEFWEKKFPAIARLSHVSKEWFLQQYEEKSLTKMVVVTNPFSVQLKTLTIRKQESSFILGMPSSTKRERVEDNEGKWVDTKPVHITCLSGLSESHRILVNAF